MDRITGSTVDPNANGVGKRGFRDGNKAAGVLATEFNAEHCNALQEEICNFIESRGIVLDSGDLTQLTQAVLDVFADVTAVPAATDAVAGIVELATPAEALAGTDTTRVVTPAGLKAAAVGIGYMLVRDEKPAGTMGGNAVNGLNIRTLNTVHSNTIAGASLSANQITLPAGTYRVRARSPAFDIDQHKAALYNVTDAVNALIGSSPNGVSAATSEAFVLGRFTINAAKVFELRHYIGSGGSNGLGNNSNQNSMVEIYAEIEIIKEA